MYFTSFPEDRFFQWHMKQVPNFDRMMLLIHIMKKLLLVLYEELQNYSLKSLQTLNQRLGAVIPRWQVVF